MNILHLATELYCGKVFFMGATLWRSFLLLGWRECSALLGEDYERCELLSKRTALYLILKQVRHGDAAGRFMGQMWW